jgi:hypothetical protein
MVVANNTDDVPWSLDTREILATLGGEGTSRPAFVNTDAGTPPVIKIARSQRGTFDFFYPVSQAIATGDRVPGFDLAWQIQTGGGLVTERTPFAEEPVQAEEVVPYPANIDPEGYAEEGYGGVGFAVGLGPYWWYDPLYPRFAFRNYPAFVVGRGHMPRYRVFAGRHGRPGQVGYRHGNGYRSVRVYRGAPYRGGAYGPGGGHRSVRVYASAPRGQRGGAHGGVVRNYGSGGYSRHGGGSAVAEGRGGTFSYLPTETSLQEVT